MGFSTVLLKKVDKTKKTRETKFLHEFLKHALVYSSQHQNYPLVSEICSVMMEKDSNAMKCFENERSYRKVVCDIIHFKDNNKHKALHYAKLNHQQMNGLALLHLEKVAHDDRKEALLCIRDDDDYYQLDPWLNESYQTIHPSEDIYSKIGTCLKVIITLLPSILLVYFDIYTDIISCINYGYIAFDNSTEIEQNCLVQLENKSCLVDGNYTCHDDTSDRLSFASRILTNGTCDESRDWWTPCVQRSAETIHLQYLAAFVIMLIISTLSLSSYAGIAINTRVGYKFSYFNIPENQKTSVISNISWFFSKLIWPLTYVIKVCEYRLDSQFRKSALLKESKKKWKLLKNLENGFENYYQILLQLYLLSPYLKSVSKLPLRKLVTLENLISTFSVPDVFCSQQNIQAALGKLLLSTLSLSYGLSSRQSTKEGEPFGQSVKNVLLAVSYFFLCYARIMALLPLFSLENPIIALLVFTFVHSIVNWFTFWGSEKLELFNNSLNEIDADATNPIQSENRANLNHEYESTTSTRNASPTEINDEINQVDGCIQSLKKVFLSCKEKIESILHSEKTKMLMSCLASHTFIIAFHKKSSKKTFVKQTLFQFSILVENIILLLLPAMFPILYPNKDCYNFELDEVGDACLIWLFGIVLQVSNVVKSVEIDKNFGSKKSLD